MYACQPLKWLAGHNSYRHTRVRLEDSMASLRKPCVTHSGRPRSNGSVERLDRLCPAVLERVPCAKRIQRVVGERVVPVDGESAERGLVRKARHELRDVGVGEPGHFRRYAVGVGAWPHLLSSRK